MKHTLIITITLFFATAYGQNSGVQQKADTTVANKYAELEKEVQKLKEEQRTQLLKSYAKEWQMNRAAEAPHVLARKLKIEKDALKDGFTVEDMKKFLEDERRAKKAVKKSKTN